MINNNNNNNTDHSQQSEYETRTKKQKERNKTRKRIYDFRVEHELRRIIVREQSEWVWSIYSRAFM